MSSFAQFAQEVSDNEQSDNGSVSNSDAEPEMQDSEVEMQEDNISGTVDNVVPENQDSGCNWQRIGPSKDTRCKQQATDQICVYYANSHRHATDVYLGKRGNAPEKQQGQRVVKQLTNFWKNSNCSITTDNYNATKNGVDVLDKVVREYSCRRCTRRWPLSLFMHFIDIAAYSFYGK
ncbi:hypothetical protein K0M31_006651 [Melipona bicolor]|uniref:PiggyBac transposable element-derived protein domain-containing protein n=1 Tax=Melipona bicolor TaxID=60889 RepID=A0AA40FS08_9HYME|nr:hypothetical protein K0M31_006651 [Melipona bicolor]